MTADPFDLEKARALCEASIAAQPLKYIFARGGRFAEPECRFFEQVRTLLPAACDAIEQRDREIAGLKGALEGSQATVRSLGRLLQLEREDHANAERELERLTKNATAREGVLKRRVDSLRKAEREVERLRGLLDQMGEGSVNAVRDIATRLQAEREKVARVRALADSYQEWADGNRHHPEALKVQAHEMAAVQIRDALGHSPGTDPQSHS